jgi:hypothetical protein
LNDREKVKEKAKENKKFIVWSWRMLGTVCPDGNGRIRRQ